MKKFIISSKVLAAALKKLSQAINKNSTLPVLVNLYCKVKKTEVELITSDLELTIIITCSCEASHEFEMLIPFEFITKVCALAADQPLTIEMNGNKGRIHGENDTYELGSLDKVKDYPNLPQPPQQKFIKMNGTFIEWLGKAKTTVAKDELRPAMQHICLDIKTDHLIMVSTDAHLIFNHKFLVESKNEDSLLVSPKIANALDGFSETEIFWNKQHIAFKSNNVTVIATRHEEKFPDYKVVFHDQQPNLVLDRNAVINALERACLNSSTSKHTVVYLKKEPGTIHFEATDLDLNRKILVDIPGSFKGDTERTAVNAAKLLALMNQVEFDEVHLSIIAPEKGIQITSESDADYKSLIMPLIVNE
jgi:DNA polymerase-3 subunit beta